MLSVHSLTRNVWRLKSSREGNIFEQVPHRKTSSVSFSVLVLFPTSEVKHLGSFSVVASSEVEDTSRSAIKIGSMELFVCSIFWEGISLFFTFCEPRIKIISSLIATCSNYICYPKTTSDMSRHIVVEAFFVFYYDYLNENSAYRTFVFCIISTHFTICCSIVYIF